MTPPAGGSQTDRRQHVRLGKHVSDSRTISTGSPQGCVLSPLLFSLYTNSCTSSHQAVKLLKFADDTTLIGLISGGDETAYRWEIDHLMTWRGQNNLELNALKSVEMVVDFRRNPAPPTPITLRDSPVDTVESFRFLPPSSPRTSSGSWTSAPSPKELNRGCTSCGSWRSSTCQRQWWCTSTPASSSPSSPPPSPSGTLLPRPMTKADCSVSSVLLRRWLAAICHLYRTCLPAGGCGPSGPKPHATTQASSRLQLALSTRPGTVGILINCCDCNLCHSIQYVSTCSHT